MRFKLQMGPGTDDVVFQPPMIREHAIIIHYERQWFVRVQHLDRDGEATFVKLDELNIWKIIDDAPGI